MQEPEGQKAKQKTGRETRPEAQLLVLGGTALAVYWLVFGRTFPLAEYYDSIPPIDYAKLTGHSYQGAAAYLGGVMVLFGAYLLGLRVAQRARPSRLAFTVVVGVSLACALTLARSYPVLAIDHLIYAVRTRGWAMHGLNPLATPPEAIPAEPLAALAAEWSGAPSPYGPVWELLSLGAFYAAGGDFLAHLFLLKMVAVLFYGGSVCLAVVIARRLFPERALAGTLFFAWNPLLLLETAQNGHNDVVMMFFALLALLAASSGGRRWAMLPFALSALTKYVTLLAAPFLLIYLAAREEGARKRAAALALHAAVLGGVVAFGMWPMWPGADKWFLLKGNEGAGRSLIALAILLLRTRLSHALSFELGKWGLTAAFGAVYLYLLWRVWEACRSGSRCTVEEAAGASGWALAWYAILAATSFHAWYLVWPLAFGFVRPPEEKLPRVLITLSCTSLLVVTFYETVRIWHRFTPLGGHAIGVGILYLPLLFVFIEDKTKAKQK